MSSGVRASELDRFVRIERPAADEEFDGAGSGDWTLVEETWAGIKDLPPVRSASGDGFASTVRMSRVRMRYRDDLTPAMRIVDGDRVLQLVGDVAELGRRAGIEFIAETPRPAGNTA